MGRYVLIPVLAGVVLALVAATGSVGDPFVELGVERPAEPRAMPELVLPDLGGRPVRLAEAFLGKVVLLGFFTTT
jgi:hypothetical protein